MAAVSFSIPDSKVIEWPLRFALGCLFVYAGVMKALDPQQFALDVRHYELVSADLSLVIAMYLPWLEIFAGAALFVRRFYHGALAITSLLTVGFIGAIGSAWWRGLDITCGCFGSEVNRTNYPGHIALNTAMLLALLVLGWLETRVGENGTAEGTGGTDQEDTRSPRATPPSDH